MVILKVNGESCPLTQVTDDWITRHIERPLSSGNHVCVQVSIDDTDVHMQLSTPTCAGPACGGRAPNDHETEVFKLWERCGLNRAGFNAGQVQAFLKQLSRMVRIAA